MYHPYMFLMYLFLEVNLGYRTVAVSSEYFFPCNHNSRTWNGIDSLVVVPSIICVTLPARIWCKANHSLIHLPVKPELWSSVLSPHNMIISTSNCRVVNLDVYKSQTRKDKGDGNFSILVNNDVGMGLCNIFILPCSYTFWHTIPTSPFIYKQCSFLFLIFFFFGQLRCEVKNILIKCKQNL